jgi:hypothetical protein
MMNWAPAGFGMAVSWDFEVPGLVAGAVVMHLFGARD